jgi:hypothetical protein
MICKIFMKSYEKLWKVIKLMICKKLWFVKYLWKVMKSYEYLWKVMKSYEYLWKVMKSYENL